MAKSSKLQVMISSRCKDNFPAGPNGVPLSDIRKEIRKEIEALKIFRRQIFEVWINEESPPKGGDWDSWEWCLDFAKGCDIFISLYNGDAGWSNGGIGICHAELEAAFNRAPAKVRLINIDFVPPKKGSKDQKNLLFKRYVDRQNFFSNGKIDTVKKLKDVIKQAVYDALLALAKAGVREASKGRFYRGEALDWSHLDLRTRKEKMCEILKDAIIQREDSSEKGNDLIVKFDNTDCLIVVNAIPAAFSIGEAKEMVGRPFLRDYELASSLTRGRGGPVHVIACHKNVTETQAIKLLGVTDATVVSAPFGIFAAENISKVQLVLIANCRDETTTRHSVQRFFEWIVQSREDRLVAKRARSRAKIVSIISKELNT